MSGQKPRRKISREEGYAAINLWENNISQNTQPHKDTVKTAVRFSLEKLSSIAPGNSVEVRVPPYGVTQCIEGPRHTRGTPPNVVETNATTWLKLVTGSSTWDEQSHNSMISASGTRANLESYLPLFSKDFHL